MRPKAKYAVIYRHREEYPISVMCRFFEVSRSGYYDFVHRMGRPEKDAALAEEIRQRQEKNFRPMAIVECIYLWQRVELFEILKQY